MGRCLFRWNNLRLRNKLMFLYLAAVFIPVVLTNYAFYWKTAETVKHQKVADFKMSLEKNKETFRKLIEGLIGYSSALYSDGSLYSSLDTFYTREEEKLSAYSDIMSIAMNRFVPIDKQVYHTYLYTNNPSLISSGVLKSLMKDDSIEPWYSKVRGDDAPGKLLLYTNSSACEDRTLLPAIGDCGQPYLSIIHKMDFYKAYSNYDKILRIDIIPKYLENTLRDSSSPGKIYLINAEGTVVFSTDGAYVGEKPGELEEEDSLVLSGAFDDVNFLKDWKIIGVYPKAKVLDAVLKSRMFIVYLTCVNFLLPSILILLFSRSLNMRIGLLLKQIKRVKNQRFEPLQITPADDEIGQLTEELDRMTIQISTLIQNVYVAELDRKQAQFNALQSQINPHYLFNTLESIRMNSINKGELETATIIRRLAKGFRRSIEWGNDQIPLREEMEFITDFLEIQKFRFEERLSYQISVDDSVKDILIPKMSILPLVENACIHGIEYCEKPGLIQVTASYYASGVRIEVADNGPGIKEEEIEVLRRYIENGVNKGSHVGLKNVHDRLKWQFGSNATLDIQSAEGKGTRVRLHIPVSPPGACL
jgi:two-component system, sensor histidine kinase YesM